MPKKDLPISISLARNIIYLGTHLWEEFTNLFWKLPGYSLFPHRQRRYTLPYLINKYSFCFLKFMYSFHSWITRRRSSCPSFTAYLYAHKTIEHCTGAEKGLQQQWPWANLMICSLKLKKGVAILKMLLWILCFWFWRYAPSKSLSHFHYG